MTAKRDVFVVMGQLEEAIEKNGQMTDALRSEFLSIGDSTGWQAPESSVIWQRLQNLLISSFPDDNPHTPEYKKIFVG